MVVPEEKKRMSVSISIIRKNVNEIQKTLGDRTIFYADNAVEITKKVKEIISMYKDSKIFYLDEVNLAKMEINQLSNVLQDAIKINIEYEKFLKMVGVSRVN
jgi:hypothetical protein